MLLTYVDIPEGARSQMNIRSVASQSDFSTLASIKQDGIAWKNYRGFGERNMILLNGQCPFFPDDPSKTHIGIMSKEITRNDRTWAVSPTLVMSNETPGNYYTSTGVMIDCDPWCYPAELELTWYHDTTQLSKKTFYPTGGEVFCDNEVQLFNRVDFTFKKTNVPGTRMRIRSIDYGANISLTQNDLLSLGITSDISVIGERVPYGAMDAVFKPNKAAVFNLFMRQPLKTGKPIHAQIDDKYIGKYYVLNGEKIEGSRYQLRAMDGIGLLDRVDYPGGIFNGVKATVELDKIFTAAKVPYTIDASLANATITGWLPPCKGREAVRQILFAIGGHITILGRENPHIKALAYGSPYTTLSGSAGIIYKEPLHRVRVISHEYTETSETATGILFYDWESDNRSPYVFYNNKRYYDKQKIFEVVNPDWSNGREIIIHDASLVGPGIAQSVAQRVYDAMSNQVNLNVEMIWDGTVPGKSTSNTVDGVNHIGMVEKVYLKTEGGQTAARIEVK